MLAELDIFNGGGAVALDLFYLLIVVAMIGSVLWIARRLSAWRIERRIGSKRSTGKSARIDTLGKLTKLRDSGSLSEEDFEAAKARVDEE